MVRSPLRAIMPALPVLLLAVVGCDQTGLVRELRQEVTRLTADNDRLDAQVKSQAEQLRQCQGQQAAFNRMPADRWALIPKAGSMTIDGKSGLREGKPQIGPAATQPAPAVGQFARVYITVKDQNGAPIPVAGTISISLFDLSTAPPTTLGRFEFTAEQAARAYHSGMFGGNQFVLDLPLGAKPADNRAVVRVRLTDYLTGQTFTAEQSLKLPN